ncbi:unnamed protein product, partial [Effrenium voratum]
MEHWEALQRAALSGDPEAEQLSGRIVGRLDTDQDRARYLAGYMQQAGDLEAWQGIYKAMEFDDKLEEQWRSLQAAALNMDRLAVLLAGVVQNRSKGEGQEAVTLQRLLKACHAQSWCDINYGVASALMNSIPALCDEEDLDSEQAGPVTGASPQANDACEFERQDMERQRMFDARALEVKVDTYAPVSSDENDRYVGDMEAVADGDVVYFDRVRRTGAHGPTVLRVLGDVAAQCSRGCVKTFKAVFIEEKGMVELGMKGRRHSGRLTPKQVQHGLGKFRGLAPCHLGTSIFCLPRFLRDVLRAGLKVHNIDTFATEPLAARFALEMRQIRKADCGASAEKMKKLKQVTPRPAEYLQYALNTAKERGGTVLALEHDGLFVHLPAEEFETFNRDMQCALGVNYPYTLQPTPSVEKALEKAKLVMCQGPLEHLWHLKDEEWRTHHHLICQAYAGNLAHHGLFAEVMLRSPAVNTNIPYGITQIFKILVDTGHKAWYSCQHLQWIITGDSAMDSLKSCMQIIAQRDLGHYHTTWPTESNEEFVLVRLERATRLTAGAPAADIYSALQKHLETKMEEGKISVEVNGKRRKWSCADLLKQAGLVEKRTKTVLGVDGKRRNVYVLLYRFPKADGGKDPIESG